MTLSGTIQKSLLLGALCFGSGCFSYLFLPAVNGWAIGAALVGVVLALIIAFKKTTAPYLAPLYAVVEGLFLGTVSAIYNAEFSGIVLEAIGSTIAVFFAMLFAYQAGIIRPTRKFVSVVMSATLGIFLFYLASMLLRLVGVNIPVDFGGPIGIGVSIVVCIIAALNLIIDFGVIEEGVSSGAPKYMEWYAGFGLLVTIIWLYLEILRLLAKLRKND